ncbi:response regulator [Pseudobdellovibrio sp. HCB154]|uniref:response regulator n=1 Tax=Pseudobdellovibrio sp. HCB154 TaxID=3386277 RepID=UPI003916D8E3
MSSAIEGLKILLVEDDIDLREIIKLELEYCGATVTEAENGQQAFTLNSQKKFDIILSDIRMPIEDGLTLTKKVKSLNSNSPIIFLMTGYSDFPASEAYHLGVEGFINKPFDFETVLNGFHRVLKPASQRWQEVFSPQNLIKIKLNQTPDEALTNKSLSVGRGGIMVLCDNNNINFGDNLELTFSDGSVMSGVVRWSHRSTENQKLEIGLEFFYLNEKAFEFYNKTMKLNNPAAYIPQV